MKEWFDWLIFNGERKVRGGVIFLLIFFLMVLVGIASAGGFPDELPMPRAELCGHDVSADKVVLQRKRYFDANDEPLIQTTVFGIPGKARYMIFEVLHQNGVFSVAKFDENPDIVFVIGSCIQISKDSFERAELGYVEKIRYSTILPWEPTH